jgi:excisionase family DNA binding protein
MTHDINPLMLTVKEAVSMSGFSRSQIYRWLADGTIIGKKLGRSTYIDTTSLRAAVSELPDYRPIRPA